MSPDASCATCGRPIDTADPTNYQRVQGWGRRTRRGASVSSDVVAREVLPVWACGTCVSRLRDGVAVQQLTFHSEGLRE